MCALNISSSPKSHLSRIESLIQDENCSLDDLLSEDDFVTAVLNKGGEFLSLYANLNNSINRERFKQIILYITTDPDPDGDIIEVYKYPFISSRLLSADSPLLNLYFSKEYEGSTLSLSTAEFELNNTNECINEISEKYNSVEIEHNDKCEKEIDASDNVLYEHNEFDLVLLLFAFVDSDQELNVTLSGYFKGAALALIEVKSKEMAEFFEVNPHVINNLYKHIDNTSISEVLLKAVLIEDSIYYFQLRKTIAEKLLVKFEDTSYSYEAIKVFYSLLEQCKETRSFCCLEEIAVK